MNTRTSSPSVSHSPASGCSCCIPAACSLTAPISGCPSESATGPLVKLKPHVLVFGFSTPVSERHHRLMSRLAFEGIEFPRHQLGIQQVASPPAASSARNFPAPVLPSCSRYARRSHASPTASSSSLMSSASRHSTRSLSPSAGRQSAGQRARKPRSDMSSISHSLHRIALLDADHRGEAEASVKTTLVVSLDRHSAVSHGYGGS